MRKIPFLSFMAAVPLFILLSASGRGFPLQNPFSRDVMVSPPSLSGPQIPEMIEVAGGGFMMGDLAYNSVSAYPKHEVIVSSFEISRYETTYRQFDLFCRETGRPFPPDQGHGREDRPAGCVSWYDAVEYCNWLSESEGRTPCYVIRTDAIDPDNTGSYDLLKWIVACDFSADGYRLPTEAEWEYAARGGVFSHGYRYSGGEDIDAVAWYAENASRYPERIGQKDPNELGLYDMSGNVYEWVWDIISDDYGWCETVEIDPTGIPRGGNRLIRGGSCFFDDAGTLVFYRKSASPMCRLPYIGFRVVRRRAAPW